MKHPHPTEEECCFVPSETNWIDSFQARKTEVTFSLARSKTGMQRTREKRDRKGLCVAHLTRNTGDTSRPLCDTNIQHNEFHQDHTTFLSYPGGRGFLANTFVSSRMLRLFSESPGRPLAKGSRKCRPNNNYWETEGSSNITAARRRRRKKR